MAGPKPSPADSELAAAEALINLAAGARSESEAEDLFRSISNEAYDRASKILFNWRALGMILDRHEGTIRNRWMKKSVTWRKTILSRTWPNMALYHRPDMRHICKEAERDAENGILEERPKDVFMLPYINMEDLSREKTILYLLNTRARNEPARFVDYELDACELGIFTRTLVAVQLHGYSMRLDGDNIQTYGTLVTVRNDNSLTAAFSPGAGLMILEIQQKLMDFLIKLCEAILDKSADTMISQYAPVAQLAPLEIWCPWRTIENLTTYTPYIPPRETSFRVLGDYLFGRYSMAQDHIRALREDPGYFEEFVLQFGDHQQEGIRDCLGRIGFMHGEPRFWDRALLGMVHNAYRSVVLWKALFKQSLVVLDIQSQYASGFDPRLPLPPEYKKQIQLFHGLLRYCAEDQRQIFSFVLPTSPPLRESFKRIKDGVNTKFVAHESADMERDPLLWIFSKIWNPDEFNYYGHRPIVDEMERLVFSQPEQRKRISPLVAEHFSGFGLLILLQDDIEHYHPWSAEFAVLDQETSDWITEEVPNILSGDFFDLSKKSVSLVLNKFGTSDLVTFYYPCDQRRTRDTVHAMWKAERNLDLFWYEADDQYQNLTGKTLSETFATRFTTGFEICPFKLERTQEWNEPREGLFTEQDGRKDRGSKPERLEKTTFNLQGTNSGDLNERGVRSGEDLFKVIFPDEKGIFKLDHRGLRVFKALFYTPYEQDGPQAITWADFLHFMSNMKFGPRKVYGNLWHFDYIGWPPWVCCQFYEPQPDSHISLRVAMRMGRRLKRIYGWHPEMFVPPEGDGEGKKKGKKKSKGKGKAS